MDHLLPRIDALAEDNYCLVDNFLPENTALELWKEGKKTLADEGKKAGIGRLHQFARKSEIRGDYISWLEPENLSPAQAIYWNELEEFRQALNRYCFLSLVDMEGHFAVYPKGSFYKKHFDQFHLFPQRLISCVFYLNPDWKDEWGGQLRMYLADGIKDIQPKFNRMVFFRSEKVEHEVLPTLQKRYSITTWMKTIPVDVPLFGSLDV